MSDVFDNEIPHIINPHRLANEHLIRVLEAMYGFLSPTARAIAAALPGARAAASLMPENFFNPNRSYHSGRVSLRRSFSMDRDRGIEGPSIGFMLPYVADVLRITVFGSVTSSTAPHDALAIGAIVRDYTTPTIRLAHIILIPPDTRYFPEGYRGTISGYDTPGILSAVPVNQTRIDAFKTVFRSSFDILDATNTDQLPRRD
jgi:hypothetical protein